MSTPAAESNATRTIPPSEWGHDHWSTLAYVETRVVDHRGYINDAQMRSRDSGYPTRLAGGVEEPNHGDWDCVRDMVSAGLLTFERIPHDDMRRLSQKTVYANLTPAKIVTRRITLTELGMKVAGELRAHKARGGNWRDFRWDGAA
jgi:hypothetical protein